MTDFGLVMPFTVCQSKGGPYEDDAYVAGFEVGRIDARLEHLRPAALSVPVHEGNMPQVDLIAMRHGYTVDADPEADGWVYVTLTRTGD